MASTLNQTAIEKQDFNGLTVAAFESRMAKEMEDLIARNGGRPRVAPSMREIPLTENLQAFAFFEKLKTGYFDLVILMTGVGTRSLFQSLETKYPKELVLETFQKTPLAVRGPKPVKASERVWTQGRHRRSRTQYLAGSPHHAGRPKAREGPESGRAGIRRL